MYVSFAMASSRLVLVLVAIGSSGEQTGQEKQEFSVLLSINWAAKQEIVLSFTKSKHGADKTRQEGATGSKL